MISEYLVKFWNSKKVTTTINVCRILLVPLAIIIIVILIRDIEAVKILAYDVCEICMNKTGCSCTCFNLPYIP